MKSSPDELPSGLSSLWRMCRFGYQNEPGLVAASFALALLGRSSRRTSGSVAEVLGPGGDRPHRTLILVAALGLAVSASATWLLRVISTRVQRHFRDKISIALESHVARLQASVATITHHERPDFLDRLSVLRDQTFVLDHMYMSFLSTCGWVLRLWR